MLTEGKSIQQVKVGKLKSENQNMGRLITKDKYHNNREEKAKEKKRVMDEFNEDIQKKSEEVEKEQAFLEEEKERNADPNLMKRQKESTMTLK